MSLNLYNEVSHGMSEYLTKKYSTSFSLGIKAFAKHVQAPVFAIYGYVRLADEIVDTFHGFDKKKLLQQFRDDTFTAVTDGISTNPVINAFQKVVNKYNIDHSLISAFLDSMERDLFNSSYEREDYDNYIFGSAEAVGLMCLYVFVNGDKEQYKKLEYPARMLGSAFQKVNFLRDIKSDIDERGRIYLPGIDTASGINNQNKKKLEEEIKEEFRIALTGIKQLPEDSRTGVYSAYLYYWFLFKKIVDSDVSVLMERRVRISNFKKSILFIKSVVDTKLLNVA